MRSSSRDAAIAVAVLAIALGTLAIDHLVGTESGPGEEGLADPEAFAVGAGIALALTAFLFGVVVRRAAREAPEHAAGKAVACSGFAIVTLPLLFLAVPFPLAGAGIALGLRARESPRKGVGTVMAAVGGLVVALGAGAYVAALVG